MCSNFVGVTNDVTSGLNCDIRGPVRAPGSNAPLIHLLVSVLYIVCLFTLFASPLDLFSSFFSLAGKNVSQMTYFVSSGM